MPPDSETLTGLFSKHATPEWYPLFAVCRTIHFDVSREVALNSSSKEHGHCWPATVSVGCPPQSPVPPVGSPPVAVEGDIVVVAGTAAPAAGAAGGTDSRVDRGTSDRAGSVVVALAEVVIGDVSAVPWSGTAPVGPPARPPGAAPPGCITATRTSPANPAMATPTGRKRREGNALPVRVVDTTSLCASPTIRRSPATSCRRPAGGDRDRVTPGTPVRGGSGAPTAIPRRRGARGARGYGQSHRASHWVSGG